MPCRFDSIFSHLTHLSDKHQRSISQASHLASIGLILQSPRLKRDKKTICFLKGQYTNKHFRHGSDKKGN